MRAVVIGAGFGGLAAAIHLARAGASVTILEKADSVGGKAALLAKDGFRFDAGPTLFTMPELAVDTFAAAGILADELARLVRLDPICRCVFASGNEFVASSDAGATRASIAGISPRDGAAWGDFLATCGEIWRCTGEPYLEAPFEGVLGLSRRILRRGLRALTIAPRLGTLGELARSHFETPEMRAYVGHFATYAGGSPQMASAALAMIAHVELNLGGFYPAGGMHGVAARLAEAAQRLGVRVMTDTEVTRINIAPTGEVTGVEVKGCRPVPGRLTANVIVANVDPLVVTSRLLPEDRRRAAGADRLAKRSPSMSGFVWGFGLAGAPLTEIPQTLLFATDFDAEIRDLFARRVIGNAPTVFVSIPTLLDPSRAPPGHHTIFAQVLAPATADTADWPAETERLRSIILGRLRREWGDEFPRRMRAEVFVTPRDLARTGSADGAIYGAAPHGPGAALERPPMRARGIRGLYFAGGATHPGGGVTLAMKSGQFAADLVLRES